MKLKDLKYGNIHGWKVDGMKGTMRWREGDKRRDDDDDLYVPDTLPHIQLSPTAMKIDIHV